MKIATLIIRILIGALLLFASLAYFFNFGKQPEPVGEMKTVMDGFMTTKYILPVAKSIELLCGLSFITGKFIKISAVILIPITLNILLINVFLIYRDWDCYKGMFVA